MKECALKSIWIAHVIIKKAICNLNNMALVVGKSAQEAIMAVEKYYALLVKLLPITELLEGFRTRELLSFDQKSELDNLISPKEKTEYFLDFILLPGLSIDFTGHFDEMVIMMKESDDVLVKDLVEKLMLHVSNVKTNSDAGIVWMYEMF